MGGEREGLVESWEQEDIRRLIETLGVCSSAKEADVFTDPKGPSQGPEWAHIPRPYDP
jgi:hypothetical protein